jgi:hypothetical protein
MATKKESGFLRMVLKAHEAGLKAAEVARPTPMTVVSWSKEYYVPDGVCGFAGVVVRPATSSFARWAKKNVPRVYNHYYGGLYIPSALLTQSMARNEAYSRAYAEVLRENGVEARMHSQRFWQQ